MYNKLSWTISDDFIETPPTDNMRRAMMNLRADQVIDGEENLTPLGYHLAALPLNVKPGISNWLPSKINIEMNKKLTKI